MLGLGCAGAVPTLRLACDFVRTYPNRTALMLAVEICSACYFVDDTMDTVIGNAICADGAAVLLITSKPGKPGIKPTVLNCESYGASEHIGKVGFEDRTRTGCVAETQSPESHGRSITTIRNCESF